MRSLLLCLCLSGCLPCLATPDCLVEHTIRVTQGGVPVTAVQVTLETTYNHTDTWQCPSEDARCETNGIIKSYADGVITLTLEDGQTITQTLQSEKAPECGCPAVNDVHIQFE